MGGWFYFAEVSCEISADIALIGDILDTDIYKAGSFRLFLFLRRVIGDGKDNEFALQAYGYGSV